MVGILMMKGIGRSSGRFLEAVPCSGDCRHATDNSIANGIAVAFISYSLLMIVTGQAKKVHCWSTFVCPVHSKVCLYHGAVDKCQSSHLTWWA